jgi:hypothetical protein
MSKEIYKSQQGNEERRNTYMSRVARSKIQNSEKKISKSENRQKFCLKNQKQIRKSNFLQTSRYHVGMLASTTLLDLSSLIHILFSKAFY